jgi:hypothetical protein
LIGVLTYVELTQSSLVATSALPKVTKITAYVGPATIDADADEPETPTIPRNENVPTPLEYLPLPPITAAELNFYVVVSGEVVIDINLLNNEEYVTHVRDLTSTTAYSKKTRWVFRVEDLKCEECLGKIKKLRVKAGFFEIPRVKILATLQVVLVEIIMALGLDANPHFFHCYHRSPVSLYPWSLQCTTEIGSRQTKD